MNHLFSAWFHFNFTENSFTLTRREPANRGRAERETKSTFSLRGFCFSHLRFHFTFGPKQKHCSRLYEPKRNAIRDENSSFFIFSCNKHCRAERRSRRSDTCRCQTNTERRALGGEATQAARSPTAKWRTANRLCLFSSMERIARCRARSRSLSCAPFRSRRTVTHTRAHTPTPERPLALSPCPSERRPSIVPSGAAGRSRAEGSSRVSSTSIGDRAQSGTEHGSKASAESVRRSGRGGGMRKRDRRTSRI